MKKYLVFLVGMAAQEIEAASVFVDYDCNGSALVRFSDSEGGAVAAFSQPCVIGWRLVAA